MVYSSNMDSHIILQSNPHLLYSNSSNLHIYRKYNAVVNFEMWSTKTCKSSMLNTFLLEVFESYLCYSLSSNHEYKVTQSLRKLTLLLLLLSQKEDHAKCIKDHDCGDSLWLYFFYYFQKSFGVSKTGSPLMMIGKHLPLIIMTIFEWIMSSMNDKHLYRIYSFPDWHFEHFRHCHLFKVQWIVMPPQSLPVHGSKE